MKKEGLQKYSGKDSSKQDISILKLINYNLLFFIPIMLSVLLSLFFGKKLSSWFQASSGIVARILMIGFMFIIFFFIIPFIRKRENISGIRYSIIAFCIVGLGITLPSALQGEFYLLLNLLTYFATYILLTFIFCPEVLGMESNITNWFAHRKQLQILFIYASIVLLYVSGFGVTYHEIYKDSPEAFSIGFKSTPDLGTFVYYSIVSFTTIGYGDITPVSTAARVVVGFEAMLGMIINVVFIAILLVFVSNAQSIAQKKEDEKVEREVEEESRELKGVKEEVEKESRELEGVEKGVIKGGKELGVVEDVVVKERKEIKEIKKKVNKIDKKLG